LLSNKQVVVAGFAVIFLGLFNSNSFAAQAADATPADAESTVSVELFDAGFHRLPPAERMRRASAGYLSRIEPTGKPSVERLSDYIARYIEANVYDPRYTVCDVRAEHQPGTTGTVMLTGDVLVPRYSSGIESTMTGLGFNVARNAIVVLPQLPSDTMPYGEATTSAASLRRFPRHASEQMNSVPLGGWVRLLRAARPSDLDGLAARSTRRNPASTAPLEQGWFLGQSPEGYVGFVSSDDLHPIGNTFEADAMLMKPIHVALADSDVGLTVPLGAWLRRAGDGWSVNFQGKSIAIPADATVARARAATLEPADIIAMASPLMQTGYEWGGTTEHGIDCSGFTQFIFKSRGIFLPRDAEQQSIVGNLVAEGEDVARLAQPGDLIFFLNERGKISHVGISLGGDRVMHSNNASGVHIGQLLTAEKGTTEPLIERTLFARRVSF
jgi:cell wall-associated NlpC family hydrolase